MESELPSQKNCLANLIIPQTFGMLNQDKITFVLGLKQHCTPNNFAKRTRNQPDDCQN